jgi:hypothetical protein
MRSSVEPVLPRAACSDSVRRAVEALLVAWCDSDVNPTMFGFETLEELAPPGEWEVWREKALKRAEAVMTNAWCEVLGIEVPTLERVKDHREANTYSLLIVALLERGDAMTLAKVAARFEAAGVAPADRALLSLKRCKPGRSPVYRDGDLYSLDPHDNEADLWAFRLGLRPPRVPRLEVVRPEPEPLPGPDVALTIEELDEAWKDAGLHSWSAQRLTLAVLDANGGPRHPQEVVDFVATRTRWHDLRDDSAKFKRRGSVIEILPDGRWSIASEAGDALVSARTAVRQRLEVARRHAATRPDPAVMEANRKAWERKRFAAAAELAKMRRVLLYAFPAKRPEALAVLDVGERELSTFVGDEVERISEQLIPYDIIGAIEVRALLRVLDVDPGDRRLAELGPPQKTKKIDKRGRTLKITPELLIRGSCGISRPFGDEKRLTAYLRDGQETKLRRRLEASVKSLFALYEYGRLHGVVRLRWGFLDQRVPIPWVHRDEPVLYHLMKTAEEMGVPLEVVVGSAPGWTDPWSCVRLAFVEKQENSWRSWLVDENGHVIDEDEIQLARLSATLH